MTDRADTDMLSHVTDPQAYLDAVLGRRTPPQQGGGFALPPPIRPGSYIESGVYIDPRGIKRHDKGSK